MELKIKELLEEGYSVEQINQINLSDSHTKRLLLRLSPKAPVRLFRDIRLNKTNGNTEELIDMFGKDKEYPYTFLGIQQMGIVVGKMGIGKSYTEEILKLKNTCGMGMARSIILPTFVDKNIVVTDPKSEINDCLKNMVSIKN